MPKASSTTHVIEIESGIGEPAFIPIVLGKELEPISVGKKAMWRIESARVLDTHAFVYFDGAALFLRSAEKEAPAIVDGEPVGQSWKELEAPSTIEIGSARLRYRSLIAPAQRSAPPKRRTPAPPIVQLPENAMPSSFPKAARPFSPGELVAPREPGEDTRVKPFDAPPPRPMFPEPEPDRFHQTAGMPAPPISASAIPSGHMHRPTGPMMPADPMMTGPMVPPGHAMMVTGPMMPPGMSPAMVTGSSYPQHIGQVTGPHAPYPYPGQRMQGQQPMTGPPPPAPPAPGLGARFRELSGPKKILIVLAPFCLLASGYLILFDEAPPPPRTAAVDAGVADAARAAVATGPVQPSCPPGFVPWTQPINGTIPCVPAMATASATIAPPASTPAVSATTKPPPPPPPPPKTATPPPVDSAAATRTLERQAVDAVAANDYPRAAKLYEQLQAQNPTNRVYAEAARILKAKADAGAP